MLVGVALQTVATNVSIFIVARVIRKFHHTSYFGVISVFFLAVGVGLELCSISAPLLIIELSYPTQVCVCNLGRV